MRLLITALIVANLLLGQEKPAEPKQEGWEAVIIPVKTLSGDSFNRLAKMLDVFNVRYRADDRLRTIIVYAPKDVVEQMRRVVNELDRPGSEAALGRNIEATLTFLRCSVKAPPEARALPPDLERVATQLRAATQYKDVQLWDIVPVRLQEGKESNQSFRLPTLTPSATGFFPSGQVITRAEAVIRKDTGRHVRFDYLKIGFKIPYAIGGQMNSFQFQDVGLNTAGDFMEGQKTVLGKVSGIDDESAIFVVIALKVLD